MKEFIVSYTKLKYIKTQRSLLYCYINNYNSYLIFLVDNPKDAYYYSSIFKDTNECVDFETNIKSTATEYSNLQDGIADQFIKYKPFTDIGMPRVANEKTTTSKLYACTYNMGDKCTWVFKSLQVAGETLVDSGDHLTFTSGHYYWIDTVRVTSDNNLGKRPQIYIDGVPQMQYNADEYQTNTNITVNYEDGTILFSAPTSGIVTADYWYSTTSEWEIAPSAGKVLRIVYIEGQASVDINPFNDVILFDIYVGTYRVGGQRYRSIQDVNNWSNAPMVAPKMGELTRDLVVYPWNYISETLIKSSLNMKLSVKLREHIPFTWPNQTKYDFLTITFYMLSENE